MTRLRARPCPSRGFQACYPSPSRGPAGGWGRADAQEDAGCQRALNEAGDASYFRRLMLQLPRHFLHGRAHGGTALQRHAGGVLRQQLGLLALAAFFGMRRG